MPNAWVISDDILRDQLQAYIDALAALSDWAIDLYKNNHTPALGDDVSDYDAATFDGYAQDTVTVANFGSVSVTAHVAKSVNSDVNTFTASAIASTQTIYGYFITDSLGDLVLAEMFATPIVVNANDYIKITPELRHANLPA